MIKPMDEFLYDKNKGSDDEVREALLSYDVREDKEKISSEKTKLRTIWFVTRPLRDPNYFPQALEALKEATNNFKEVWESNRPVQKAYEQSLIDKKLKRNNISADGSGGRTWGAMLRTYSLVYMDGGKRLVPTKAGLALLKGKKKFENLRKQLLTLQIPNSYFLSSGFRPKFEEDFRIRPIRFLIKVVNSLELNFYVTKEEIIYFVLKARHDSQLQETVREIVRFRNANEQVKMKMKNEVIAIDYRSRSDKSAREFEATNGDVAHTFMLQAAYTELVDYPKGKSLLRVKSDLSTSEEINILMDSFDKRYPFNTRYKISEARFSESAGLDIDSYKSRPITKALVASNQSKEDKLIEEIISKYPTLLGASYSDILEVVSEHFSPKKAIDVTKIIMDKTKELTNIDDVFIDSYLNQQDNLKFEEQTVEVLKALGFVDTKYQPKPVKKNTKTGIEILIPIDDENVALIDAKNYGKKFTLTANLANHMASEYIPEYDGYDGKHVRYFGYITASKIGGVANLEKIIKKADEYSNLKVNGSLISASALLGLLDYCMENDIEIEQKKSYFIELLNDNKAYETYGEVAFRLQLT